PTDTFKGAFLMNRRHGKPVDPAECISDCGGTGCPLCGNDCSPCYIGPVNNNFHCWNKSTEILANAGIVSETCARYYYKGGAKPGLTFSFVNCNDDVGF
nr:hypothetical protein [Candidatus Omnitrophota bacterium]